ncbi:uncharacterized protein LOC116578067 isoform X2 [Mustela erminea]|uniref:uncharacterized protein LOC116578067 isoform X2 n=1 Tax=Mustela erminea TaxID=36723 RepID=UPI0013871EDD|nr:uncharacterized protein LOC116578067 isoform X2 [Mustela erminea]
MRDWKTLKRFQVLLPLSPPTCTQSGTSLTVLGAHVLRPATGSHYSLYMFMGGITGPLPQSLPASMCLGHLCCSRVSWMLTCAHGRLTEPREHPGRSLMPIPAFEEAGSFLLPTTVEQRSASLEPTARGRPARPGHTHLQTLPRCGISALWKPPCYKQVCHLFLHRLLSALTEHAECRAARGMSGTGGAPHGHGTCPRDAYTALGAGEGRAASSKTHVCWKRDATWARGGARGQGWPLLLASTAEAQPRAAGGEGKARGRGGVGCEEGLPRASMATLTTGFHCGEMGSHFPGLGRREGPDFICDES